MKYLDIYTATPIRNGFVKITGVYHSKEEAMKAARFFPVIRNGAEFFELDYSEKKGKHTMGYVMNHVNYITVPWHEPVPVLGMINRISELQTEFSKRGWSFCEEIESVRGPLVDRSFVRACLTKNHGDTSTEIPTHSEVIEVYSKIKSRNKIYTDDYM